MSWAFAGLGAVAALVLIIIIVSNIIIGGAQGLALFIANYSWILAIILFVIFLVISVGIYDSLKKSFSVTSKVMYSIASFLVLSQNAVFLFYGLYRALTAYPDDAFLLILGVGGYIFVYFIDMFLTVVSICAPMEKEWGAIVPFLTSIGGLILIVNW
ncbi:MAG: hypothetical protein ACI4GX_04155 [Ruminococcus sp.]